MDTISQLLHSSNSQFRIYDIGRKIDKIPKKQFEQIELNQIPPLPPLPPLHRGMLVLPLYFGKSNHRNLLSGY